MKNKLHIEPDICKAKTLHTDFYTNAEYFEASKEKIFANVWQFVANRQSLEKQGDMFPFTLLEGYLNEPLLLTLDKENALHCLSNVCTHRGNLLAYKACNARQLTCKYHGRAFDLAGNFLSMPSFQEAENFPSPSDNLKKLPLFAIGDLLFTSLNATISADSFFSDILQRVSHLPLDKMVFYPNFSKTYQVKAHWALYCENYLEGFHIPFVHQGLNEVIDYQSYTTEIFPYSNLQLGLGKEGDICFDLPPTSVDYGKKVAAYYFWVFPNLMFNFYPWGLSLNVVEPQGISDTKVSFYTYIFDETKWAKGAGAELDKVELEDEEVVENVQKGIRSRFYTQGRYSPTKEQGTHHFHTLISTFFS